MIVVNYFKLTELHYKTRRWSLLSTLLIFFPTPTKLREGNVFTGMCHLVGGGEGVGVSREGRVSRNGRVSREYGIQGVGYSGEGVMLIG